MIADRFITMKNHASQAQRGGASPSRFLPPMEQELAKREQELAALRAQIKREKESASGSGSASAV